MGGPGHKQAQREHERPWFHFCFSCGGYDGSLNGVAGPVGNSVQVLGQNREIRQAIGLRRDFRQTDFFQRSGF